MNKTDKKIEEMKIRYPNDEQYSVGKVDDRINNYELGWVSCRSDIAKFVKEHYTPNTEVQKAVEGLLKLPIILKGFYNEETGESEDVIRIDVVKQYILQLKEKN